MSLTSVHLTVNFTSLIHKIIQVLNIASCTMLTKHLHTWLFLALNSCIPLHYFSPVECIFQIADVKSVMNSFLEELCALCMLWSTAAQQFQQSCSTVAAEAGESKAARFKRAVQTQANLCSRGSGFEESNSCSLPMWYYISRHHGDTLSVVLCISGLSWPSKETQKTHQMHKNAEASD